MSVPKAFRRGNKVLLACEGCSIRIEIGNAPGTRAGEPGAVGRAPNAVGECGARMMWTACGQPGMIGHEVSVRDAAASVVSQGPTRYHSRIRAPPGSAC